MRERILREREELPKRLIDFAPQAWRWLGESAPYQSSWALDGFLEHLQYVTEGHIKRLLINYPPRCGKTNGLSLWQAWTWTRARNPLEYLSGAGVRFLAASYSDNLSLLSATSVRSLVQSPWYQARWADLVSIRPDISGKHNFATTAGGARHATSVRGGVLGFGGDAIVVDDPHNTKEVESDPDRETAKAFWSEISGTRLNDPKKGAIVVCMQRLHQEDVSGIITSSDAYQAGEWVHYMVPMEFDPARHCRTIVDFRDAKGRITGSWTWADPRTTAGELMWPERFGRKEVDSMRRELGSYRAAGRMDQLPHPPGGGIFREEWWQAWDYDAAVKHGVMTEKQVEEARAADAAEEAGADVPAKRMMLKFPPFDLKVGVVDTAFTEDEENDPSAMTVFGIWFARNVQHGAKQIIMRDGSRAPMTAGRLDRFPNAMMVTGWAARLNFSDLIRKVETTATRHKLNHLLIENKANGISVYQELRRMFGPKRWGTELVDPKSQDKVARAISVTNLIEAGLVWVPARWDSGGSLHWYGWADKILAEMGAFPKSTHDDRTDTVVAGLMWLRRRGILRIPSEVEDDMRLALEYRSEPAPLYDV